MEDIKNGYQVAKQYNEEKRKRAKIVRNIFTPLAVVLGLASIALFIALAVTKVSAVTISAVFFPVVAGAIASFTVGAIYNNKMEEYKHKIENFDKEIEEEEFKEYMKGYEKEERQYLDTVTHYTKSKTSEENNEKEEE